MRFVFFILLIHFATTEFAQAAVQEYRAHEKITYSRVHETGICLDIFFKEDSEEKKDHHKAALTVQLNDFSFLTTVLTKHHSGFTGKITAHPLTHEPLFRLNCSLRI